MVPAPSCAPAHDDRDFEFARKFGLPIVQVIAKDGKEIENMTEAYTEANGIMINSGDWNGLESAVPKRSAPHDRGKGLWPQDGQLQAEGLGILTPALLGRAYPHHPLSQVRLRACA